MEAYTHPEQVIYLEISKEEILHLYAGESVEAVINGDECDTRVRLLRADALFDECNCGDNPVAY